MVICQKVLLIISIGTEGINSQLRFPDLNLSNNLYFLQVPRFGLNSPQKLPINLASIVSLLHLRITLWGNPSPTLEITLGPAMQLTEIPITTYQALPTTEGLTFHLSQGGINLRIDQPKFLT